MSFRVVTSSGVSSARSAISSMVGGRPSSAASSFSLLVLHAALDRLADPVRRVGGELEAAAPVELLGGADQAEDALLDEVEQRHAVGRVALGDRDHEREVRGDHALLGRLVAVLDALGQLDLLVGGQQRVLAHLAQEERQRVGRLRGELPVEVVRRRHARPAAVVGDLEAAPPRLVLHEVLGVLVELEAGAQGGEVRQVQAARLLGLVEQAVDRGAGLVVDLHHLFDTHSGP
jgi:hypothetical protein